MASRAEQLEYANKVIREFNESMQDADNLVKKHRLVTQRVETRHKQSERIKANE